MTPTRHLAIGDIHGCYKAFSTLLDDVSPGKDDVVVLLGDYVDRGPDSRRVIELVMELTSDGKHIALRGNHEIMMIEARLDDSWLVPWLQYGGDATLASYATGSGPGSFDDVPRSHIEFIEQRLLRYYEIDGHFFVHGNVDPDVPLGNQTDAAIYWQKYRNPEPHCSGKVMVCGHTAQLTGFPATNGHSICIDTYAYGGGWLSCLDTDSGTIWQANEAGDSRRFQVEDIA